MTKKELVAAIAAKSNLSKTASEAALAAVLDVVKEELKAGRPVQLTGFGTFSVKARKARTGKNPATGEAIKIKATKVPAFKAGKGLKEAVAKKTRKK